MTGSIDGGRTRGAGNGRPGSTRTVDSLRLVPYLCSQRIHRRTLCCRKVVGAISDN